MKKLIQGLDPNQKSAVLHTDGPLLVLAGAGSGKTRVLTHRIARLVLENHCKAENILAVTFTNKAAREMRKRIAKLTSKDVAKAMCVCTFHSLGARILRENGSLIGIHPNFSILDDNERTSTLKQIMRTVGKKVAKENPSEFGNAISLAKNASISSELYTKENPDNRKVGRVFKSYSKILMKRQCVDFDDLLLLPLKLFMNSNKVLMKYRKLFKYISVDEFQDTNIVQMKLINLLCQPVNNLMVVGDDDQSIYSWRGAVIDNIINFNRKFAGCKTVVLNKNYRSTEQIVKAAYAVIGNNDKRTKKNVSAAESDGIPIISFKADDEQEEVEWVIKEIINNNKSNIFHFKHQAILFRTNAMMRRFEEELRIQRVPYVVQGSMSFFDRKEVKDVLCYLRFFANTNDELSLERLLKVPTKGITPSTIEKLEDFAGNRKMSLWEAFERYTYAGITQVGQIERIDKLITFFNKYSVLFERGNLSETFRSLLTEIGYIDLLKKAYKNDKSLDMRLDNIEEIIHGLAMFEKRNKHKKSSLVRYLQETALISGDNPNESKNNTGITLMTIHKSKGLEYPVVFLPVLDDDIIPSPRSRIEGGIEEERRLFYVAMTRAEKRLILSYPKTKLFRKKSITVKPCRFIREIPEEYLDGKFGEEQDQEYEAFSANFFEQMREKFSKTSQPD